VVVQRFCKPKVGGSNPSPGTTIRRLVIVSCDCHPEEIRAVQRLTEACEAIGKISRSSIADNRSTAPCRRIEEAILLAGQLLIALRKTAMQSGVEDCRRPVLRSGTVRADVTGAALALERGQSGAQRSQD
jgi:hypothetical protein